ncbi:MAG: hypothetical protein RSB67_02870 [Clostridia bacterium]
MTETTVIVKATQNKYGINLLFVPRSEIQRTFLSKDCLDAIYNLSRCPKRVSLEHFLLLKMITLICPDSQNPIAFGFNINESSKCWYHMQLKQYMTNKEVYENLNIKI